MNDTYGKLIKSWILWKRQAGGLQKHFSLEANESGLPKIMAGS